MKPAEGVYHLRSRPPGVPRFGMRLFLLAYLLFLFIGPLIGDPGTAGWLATLGSLPLFLLLYVATWLAIDERRQIRALVLLLGIAALGLAVIPFNIGGNTYVVYAAAFVPFLLPPRYSLLWFLGLIVAVSAVSLALPSPDQWWVMVPTALLIVMIGGANLFYAESLRRSALLFQAKEEVEEMATLAERERISRDLHDLLGHTLSVITLKSELASRLAESDPERAVREIREVERVSRDALAEVRTAVEGYRGLGFSGELRNAARALEAAGVHLDVTVGDVPMSLRHESVMALALREAVTNIVRHARAHNCRITFVHQDGALILTVADDGQAGTVREGRGLAGMRERLEAVGGSLVLATTPGIALTARIPVHPNDVERRTAS